MSMTQSYSASGRSVGHSARVQLTLVVNGRSLRLAKAGPDLVVLAEPATLATGPAELVLHVDGAPVRWEVEVLPHEPGSTRVPIRRLT